MSNLHVPSANLELRRSLTDMHLTTNSLLSKRPHYIILHHIGFNATLRKYISNMRPHHKSRTSSPSKTESQFFLEDERMRMGLQ